MSRSTVAKSRAEKGGKSTNAPTPAVTHEIIPGKFNDQDWNLMVDHDDGDEYMLELVGEICDSALDVIYQNYLQRQLVPFTVLQAKDALLQIIEWQFLSRDMGEGTIDADPGWMQEEEPEPAVTDCWAQGSVPRQLQPKQDDIAEEVEPEVAEADAPAEAAVEVVAEQEEPQPQEDPASLQRDETYDVSSPITIQPSTTPREEGADTAEETRPAETSAQKSSGKRRQKFRPYKGKLKSAGLSRMTESLEQSEIQMYWDAVSQHTAAYTPDIELLNMMPKSCQPIIKLQAGRPPGNRDIMYDASGNVVHMTQVNPERLPSHKVRTRFHVVDPQVEAAQARLEAMRTGLKNSGARPKQYKAAATSGSKVAAGQANAAPSNHQQRAQDILDALPPSLLECMEVSAGVTLREGDRMKRGPKPHLPRSELVARALKQGLRPVSFRASIPTLTVQELLERESPIVRPLQTTTPIPPIQQKAMEMA